MNLEDEIRGLSLNEKDNSIKTEELVDIPMSNAPISKAPFKEVQSNEKSILNTGALLQTVDFDTLSIEELKKIATKVSEAIDRKLLGKKRQNIKKKEEYIENVEDQEIEEKQNDDPEKYMHDKEDQEKNGNDKEYSSSYPIQDIKQDTYFVAKDNSSEDVTINIKAEDSDNAIQGQRIPKDEDPEKYAPQKEE